MSKYEAASFKFKKLEKENASLDATNKDLAKQLVLQEKETLRAQASLNSCMVLFEELSNDRNKYSKSLAVA